jgi:hypothetical protein
LELLMKVPQAYLDAVNETLPKCGPAGAYSVGLVSALIQQITGEWPTKIQVQAAALCASVPAATELAGMFISEMKAAQRKNSGGSSLCAGSRTNEARQPRLRGLSASPRKSTS